MMDLRLGEIAAACGGKLVLRGGTASDTCVSSVVIDSRQVTEGGVFLAVIGERVDGHKFISSVFGKGAVLAVTMKTPEQAEADTGVPSGSWGSYLLVEDTLQALKEIAEYYRRKLSIPVVGITGSVGKTSTKEFIAGVLAEKYHVLKTEGNYNNEIGVPLTLLKIRGEHTAAVVEMGISDFGEMHRLSKMARPNICVITNIGQSHLENLKTRDGILKAKSEIFDYMAEDGQVCLNGEDDKLRALTEVKGRKAHFFGWGNYSPEEVTAGDVVSRGLWGSDAVLTIRQPGKEEASPAPAAAEISAASEAAAAENVAVSGAESAFIPEDGSVRIAVHVPLPGRHMVLNGAAAACVAGLLGLSPEQIASGIGKIKPVGGRNNLIPLEEYTLIDDCYNANPASMKAALDLLSMADTEKVAILGDMFELGENSRKLHEEIGAYAAAAGIHRIYCVGKEAEYIYQAACGEISPVKNSDEGKGMKPSGQNSGGGSGMKPYVETSEEGSGMKPYVETSEGGSRIKPFVETSEGEKGRITFGQNSYGGRLLYFPAKEELFHALEEDPAYYIPKGSTVLIKASHGMEFSQIVDFLKKPHK